MEKKRNRELYLNLNLYYYHNKNFSQCQILIAGGG